MELLLVVLSVWGGLLAVTLGLFVALVRGGGGTEAGAAPVSGGAGVPAQRGAADAARTLSPSR